MEEMATENMAMFTEKMAVETLATKKLSSTLWSYQKTERNYAWMGSCTRNIHRMLVPHWRCVKRTSRGLTTNLDRGNPVGDLKLVFT